MVVKKQLKKISKKILVLGLATSIIFTSCFSTKKIDAHATSVAAGLGAYTLYQICLYIGGIAATTLGIGYFYENRDDIAEFGKDIIDNMSDLPALGWLLGLSTSSGNYVFGSEALQEVKDTEWTVIQGGGHSPRDDHDDDGDADDDDMEIELNLNKMFLTSAGFTFLKNNLKSMYESWVQKDLHFFDSRFGAVDKSFFDGFVQDANGNYIGDYKYTHNGNTVEVHFVTSKPLACFIFEHSAGYTVNFNCPSGGQWWEGSSSNISVLTKNGYNDEFTFELNNVPVHYSSNNSAYTSFRSSGIMPVWSNLRTTYRIGDWIADDDEWAGYLEDIATSLRSLRDLANLTQELCNSTLSIKPSIDSFADMLNDYANNQYVPSTEPITNPEYYPLTNPTPHLLPSEFPNYVPSAGGDTDNPDSGDIDDVPEIDLDGLLSIFNILFYLIMIIVMLIYLFLSCLAFIVMIFRIPASSTMLPEEMVMGFDHLKTIMIPGMNISIYGFAMALIYMFIIFAVIKLIRLEINDFKFPRSYK